MRFYRSKTAIAVSLFLLFAMAISLFALPAANAQTYVSTGKCTTYAYIGATPNPIGVNQETLLHIGITQQLANVALGWEGLSVTITKPDGSTETISNIRTDSTGGTGRVYVPTMTGNYTLQTHFPEQRNPATIPPGGFSVFGLPVNTTMLASDSDKLTLVVQEEPIKVYPGNPLPTEYWTRPINAQFREWYTVSGSSWMDNNYNEGPETPHILWTKPLTTGGLVGGTLGLVGSGGTSVAMENGDAYEGKFGGGMLGTGAPLILAGKLYYQAGAYDRPRLWHCVDLRTGEELWAKTFLDNQSISFGQLFYWQSYNYMGTFAYLWVTVGTTWTAFDPSTGEWMATITNVPSGTRIEGPRGEIYLYTVSQSGGYMQLWNMSAFISLQGSWGSAFSLRQYNASSGTYRSVTSNGSLGSESTSGAAERAARAWSWNITIPKGLPGSVRAVNLTDRVVGSNLNATDVNIWAFSVKKGQEGALLFNNDWKAPADWANQSLSWVTADLTTNIGLVWSKEQRKHYAFSLETGNYLWITESQHYLNIYGAGRRIYEGKLYSVGYSGIVYCYDLTTGKTNWTYDARDPYTEILWSDNWPEFLYFATGGKLYYFHQEHSGNQPLPRGAPAACLNATTGEEIWRVDGLYRTTSWGGSPIMGDSVIAMYNTYDQQVYAIGKGPSATTVTAPDIGVTLGKSVLVRGIVTDVSPGAEQTDVKLRFPNGVPAVADDSVGEWMKYVYVQFARPADTVGVEVVVSVLDPNNNYYEVGRATSDASGVFGVAFTPEVPGKYTVFASFEGSGAYYGSFAETIINVEEAPAATPSPTPTPAPMTDTYVMGFGIGIIIAIVAVGLVIILLFRKR
jgi:outer membrane protein assembly factor BamB